VEEAIDIDVKRSFHKLSILSAENLTSILKVCAATNPTLNYCQGMNFMAGFLYLAMDCYESLGFGVMRAVIDKF
jgi:hypothetical protein